MAPPCICKRWSDILKGLEVVKFNAEYWIKISVFRGFLKLLKTFPEVHVFRGSQQPSMVSGSYRILIGC